MLHGYQEASHPLRDSVFVTGERARARGRRYQRCSFCEGKAGDAVDFWRTYRVEGLANSNFGMQNRLESQ